MTDIITYTISSSESWSMAGEEGDERDEGDGGDEGDRGDEGDGGDEEDGGDGGGRDTGTAAESTGSE